ncbi:3'-5' exonuclease [Telmatospirillum sp.]|uniref:3'-5' exonuclease n=1 Tax=Telmatospirillum sp. TaxID=2079197 RepID=UPI00283CAE7A|nr:3'-5' exonuclease [Telmatospirillum sp.]MDR3435046.1 3'-5' exonuclease [Telmatospirillum sp.]
MRVIALDFETANEGRASACAVGLSWIESGTLVRTEQRLIRPKDMRFSSMNIAIHGIFPEDVADQPEFPEVWSEFIAKEPISLLLAHNAAFDMSVLRASLDLYGIAWPSFSYLCTVKVARAIWPDLPNHRLSTVAEHLGVDLIHHQAGSDAQACAAIALAAMNETACADLFELPAAIGITLGSLCADGYQPCRVEPKSKSRLRSRHPAY